VRCVRDEATRRDAATSNDVLGEPWGLISNWRPAWVDIASIADRVVGSALSPHTKALVCPHRVQICYPQVQALRRNSAHTIGGDNLGQCVTLAQSDSVNRGGHWPD
jgi:hypothetical protein